MAGPGSTPRHPPRLLLAALLCAAASWWQVAASSDADALLKFKAAITDGNGALRDWVAGSKPCGNGTTNWAGVICDEGVVRGLQLEDTSLSGRLSFDALAAIPGIRTLSFMNNGFEGPMPDITKLGALKSIYLSANKLSGEIPDDAFKSMGSLRRVYLSSNRFSGSVPSSLAASLKLWEVRLDDNHFVGGLPDLRQPELKLVNVSFNNLEGQIPAGLSKMEASLFAGNKGLCGPPLRVTCDSPSKKLSTPLLFAITVIAISIMLATLAGVIIGILRRPRNDEEHLSVPPSSKTYNHVHAFPAEKTEKGSSEHSGSVKNGKGDPEPGKLVFLREDRERFELQDLLKASAEVLVSGNLNLGSSYKATLLNGLSFVVKRFKDMNGTGKEDFHEHMRRLGRLSHPNLLPLVAYYYRKEEKLLVTDHIPRGSLAQLLHGNNGTNVAALDWPTRLKIVKGVARALGYLYEELPMLTVPHGHLKSSNVLLNDAFEPLLTDYALVPVMDQAHAAQVMVAYRSPECLQYGRASKKSDVWSLGILILEILTGEYPTNYVKQRRGSTDLASWVNSIVGEARTGEVFDGELTRVTNSEGELSKLLQIGLACCKEDAEKRWGLGEAIQKIEELRERDSEEDNSLATNN